MVDMKVPSLTWYLDRIPEEIDFAHLDTRLERNDDSLYVWDTRDWDRLSPEKRSQFSLLGRQGRFQVFERRPAGPAGTPVDEFEPPR